MDMYSSYCARSGVSAEVADVHATVCADETMRRMHDSYANHAAKASSS